MATGTTNYGFRKPDANDNVIVLTDVADNMDDIDTELKRVDDMATATAGGVWAAYTPTWASSGTQPALGNGTLVARWAKTGKIVHVKLRLVAGTTTTFGTGDWTFSLPVAPSATHANLETIGSTLTLDVSAASYKFDPVTIASAASVFKPIGIAVGGFYGPTTPMTWASTDFMNVSLTYESA